MSNVICIQAIRLNTTNFYMTNQDKTGVRTNNCRCPCISVCTLFTFCIYLILDSKYLNIIMIYIVRVLIIHHHRDSYKLCNKQWASLIKQHANKFICKLFTRAFTHENGILMKIQLVVKEKKVLFYILLLSFCKCPYKETR